MAHIFKHPYKNTKGIIVFTHKEWGYFSGNKLIRKVKRERYLPKVFSQNTLRQPYAQKVIELKKQYYIGVHFGWHQTNMFSSTLIDFVMGGEGTLPLLGQDIYRIPLNSRNFIPAEFKIGKGDKIWDIVTVGRNVLFKNYTLMFQEIKKLLTIKPKIKVLFIIPSQTKMPWGVHRALAHEFSQIFNAREQGQLTMLLLHPELELGINQNSLVEFYNRSKVFTLFSRLEGESRVISEALCCGLPVVVYDKLIGGGRDLLNDNNSVMFPEYSQGHAALNAALKKFPTGILDKPEKLTREDFTIPELKKHLNAFYRLKDKVFDEKLINTDHLDMRLPAHYSSVAWKLDWQKPTADILSRAQFSQFCDTLEL